jgi:lysophospholipase L1-like esterase
VIRYLTVVGALLLLVSQPLKAQSPATSDLRLTLPPAFYAVAGHELSIYYDNVVLTERPEDFRFVVACELGKSEARRWTMKPTEKDVGEHPLKLRVLSNDGNRELATAATTLRVLAADAGAKCEIKLLIVGDSLTHATLYPNELARLLSGPGNPMWKMLGTHRPVGAAAGVAHEGYGGWTWERFAKHYEPQPDPAQRKHSSPFVFLRGDKPQLDVARYIQEKCGGQDPDYVTFLLGINDCFAANPDDPQAIDQRIDQVFEQAETLISGFRAAAPNAELGLCLTTPPNARESGFEANYKGRYHRWGWKRIQHRLVERELKQFGGREKERIYVVPTELNLDPVDGYPVDNGVHPNAAGYAQIGQSLYAWLKSRMSRQPAGDESAGNWRSLPLIKDGQVDPSWVHLGYGGFVVEDGVLKTECSEQGLGMLLYKQEKLSNCQIRVVFRAQDEKSNAGVFVRIDDGVLQQIGKNHAPAKRDASGKLSPESLQAFMDASEKEIGAWYAVHHGYEVQICDGSDAIHRTGAIYSLAKAAEAPKTEPRQWRTMIITLKGNLVLVEIDGKPVTTFDPASKDILQERKWFEPRREPKRPQAGYIGLQNHDPGDVVWFKEVSIRPLKARTEIGGAAKPVH